MKIVILAAGKGSRLHSKEEAKPLTRFLDGKSILQHQIESIEKYASRHDIMVVVGYHKEAIMDAFDDLLFVYAPNYERENTSKSLLRAIKKCREDILWINGDLLFHPSILKKLIAEKRNCMVTTACKVGPEEVKYKSNKEGKILEVSKTVKDGEGEAIGINYFTKESLPLLEKHLEYCQDQDYFEKAIEGCIQEGLEVWTCPVDRSLCIEIDFPEDLEKANALMEDWPQ